MTLEFLIIFRVYLLIFIHLSDDDLLNESQCKVIKNGWIINTTLVLYVMGGFKDEMFLNFGKFFAHKTASTYFLTSADIFSN